MGSMVKMKLLFGTGNQAKLSAMKTNKYYYDLSADELERFAVEDGFLQFFEKVLNLD